MGYKREMPALWILCSEVNGKHEPKFHVSSWTLISGSLQFCADLHLVSCTDNVMSISWHLSELIKFYWYSTESKTESSTFVTLPLFPQDMVINIRIWWRCGKLSWSHLNPFTQWLCAIPLERCSSLIVLMPEQQHQQQKQSDNKKKKNIHQVTVCNLSVFIQLEMFSPEPCWRCIKIWHTGCCAP